MIRVPAAMIADRSPDVLGHLVDIAQQLLDRLIVEFRILDGLVQIRDVRGMMLIVMDLHRPGIDVGFQGIERVGQRGELVRHVDFLLREVQFWQASRPATRCVDGDFRGGMTDNRSKGSIPEDRRTDNWPRHPAVNAGGHPRLFSHGDSMLAARRVVPGSGSWVSSVAIR